MTMKPTLRRNGEAMITLRLRFDATGEDIAAILAEQLWGTETAFGEKPEVELSRTKIEDEVRAFFFMRGADDAQNWRERIGEDDADEAWDWAMDQVRRLWPEMASNEHLS